MSPHPIHDQDLAVGVFPDRAAAERAVADLRALGVPDDQIGVIVRDTTTRSAAAGSQLEAGAVTGAVAGGATGTLLGIAVAAAAIPGVGPVVGGGILAGVLASAATGAVAGGVIGGLIGLGIPEEEAAYYNGQFEAGKVLVTVRAAGRRDAVRTALERHGGFDALSRDRSERLLHSAHPTGGIAAAPVSNPPGGKPADVEMTDVGGGHVRTDHARRLNADVEGMSSPNMRPGI